MSNVKSKADHISDFVRAQAEVEACIQPFKEDLKDLKRSYVENDWLTKEEIKLAVKAFRLLKDDTNFDMLGDYYNQVEKAIRGE